MNFDADAQPVLTGVAEQFERRRISGWIEVDAGSKATRIGLYINEHPIQETWSFPSAERESVREVQQFRFAVRDFWRFCSTTDKVSVRADGQILPIAKKGMYFFPREDGDDSLETLAELKRQGYVFGQTGGLQLSKTVDKEWQSKVVGLYHRVNDVLAESFDYEAFLCYGSLLGQVRNNGLIGHDMDFDCAYVSNQPDGPSAADELRDIAFRLIECGFDVKGKRSVIAIGDAQSADVRIDLFHLFFDADGNLAFPFGVAGSTKISRNDWQGVRAVEYLGSKAYVPVNAEPMTEHMYGAAWRVPNPGFKWQIDRTDRDRSGLLTAESIEEVYWSNFYAHVSYTTGSTFCTFVESMESLPNVVVDLGCGDGRDSYAFVKAGRKVVGLDRSEIGVRHATAKAKELGFDAVKFAACDAGDGAGLRSLIAEARKFADGGPLLFYTRFFLHSIPEETQAAMMETIRDNSIVGDCFAAEFRTDRDEANNKVHGKHYRRFQNGPAFAVQLQEIYGFDVAIQQEGNGFSPYKGEDPDLFRVVARRNAAPARKAIAPAGARPGATPRVEAPGKRSISVAHGRAISRDRRPVTVARIVRVAKRRSKETAKRVLKKGTKPNS